MLIELLNPPVNDNKSCIFKVHPSLSGVGYGSTIVATLVGCYYNVIIAWCLFYLGSSFQVSISFIIKLTFEIGHDNTVFWLVGDQTHIPNSFSLPAIKLGRQKFKSCSTPHSLFEHKYLSWNFLKDCFTINCWLSCFLS